MFQIRGVEGKDANSFFPMIYQTSVTNTIQWDGPNSLAEYRAALTERAEQHKKGEIHMFTIVEKTTGALVGSIDIRPENDFKANIGLWVGEKFQGKGAGTQAVALVLKYGFEKLKLEKIEASVFVGNISSRRIFEKNGFKLEGTIRAAVRKRGKLLDQWFLGITRAEYEGEK